MINVLVVRSLPFRCSAASDVSIRLLKQCSVSGHKVTKHQSCNENINIKPIYEVYCGLMR